MSRTKTRSIGFQKLVGNSKNSAIVIKLMIACNDLQLANMAQSDWEKELSRDRLDRKHSARMYFVRLQIGHLFEAMKIIDQMQGDPFLLDVLARCDQQTQDSFRKLQDFVPDGARRGWLDKMVGQLRHNLVFHYYQSDALIERAIADRAGRGNTSMITRGELLMNCVSYSAPVARGPTGWRRVRYLD